jgi:DNA-binding GntR family transcriptional regulator
MRFQTLRQKAYRLLTDRLASGELASGMPLIETGLAKELGMSRTPIREAIRQLEIEGVVEYAPRFGAIVRIPSRDELAEMYTVREALESYAAAEAAQRISDKDLAKLDSLLANMQGIEAAFVHGGEESLQGENLWRFLSIDLQFHKVVVRASGNRYMARIIDGTRLLSRVFRATFWVYDGPALNLANKFHARLLAALRNHDAENARTCIIEAMQVSRRNAIERWDSLRCEDDSAPA